MKKFGMLLPFCFEQRCFIFGYLFIYTQFISIKFGKNEKSDGNSKITNSKQKRVKGFKN